MRLNIEDEDDEIEGKDFNMYKESFPETSKLARELMRLTLDIYHSGELTDEERNKSPKPDRETLYDSASAACAYWGSFVSHEGERTKGEIMMQLVEVSYEVKTMIDWIYEND